MFMFIEKIKYPRGLSVPAFGSVYMFNNIIYLVQKETQCFYLQFWGLKVIDFIFFNSVVLPSNKDLDCIVSS